jgi:hypothetical protein
MRRISVATQQERPKSSQEYWSGRKRDERRLLESEYLDETTIGRKEKSSNDMDIWRGKLGTVRAVSSKIVDQIMQGFVVGSAANSVYDGALLAEEQDVIVVSIK